MIVSLLRRNPVVLGAPLMWAGFGLLGVMYATIANRDLAAGRAPELDSVTVTTIATCLLLLGAVVSFHSWQLATKATPFELSLPIPSRALWISRVTSVLLPFVGGLCAAGLAFWVAYDAEVERLRLAAGLNVTGLVALVPFVFHTMRIDQAKGGMPLPLLAVILVLLAWLSAVTGMDTFKPALACLAGAIVLGGFTLARLPAALTVVPDTPARPPVTTHPGRDLTRLPLVGAIVTFDRYVRPVRWASRPQFFGLLGLGVLINVLLVTGSPLAVYLTIALTQLIWLVRVVNGAARSGHLPIAPWKIFAHAIAPGVLVGVFAHALLLLIAGVPFGTALGNAGFALGVVAYLVCWGLTSSIFLAAHAARTDTRAPWQRLLTEPRHWLAAICGATWLGRHTLAEVLGLSTLQTSWPVWVPAAGLFLLIVAGLHRDFRRIELAPMAKGIEP